MPKVKQTPLQKHCKKLYASLKRRIEEKRNKNGRIIRHGRPIPFTEDQLFTWLQTKWEHGSVICRYCLVPLTFINCAYDHETPLSRGGSAELDNLLPICHEDNQYKGRLTPQEFLKLRYLLRTEFKDEARSDIEGRLKKAVRLAASLNWSRKRNG